MFKHLFFFLLTHFAVGLLLTILFVSLKQMGRLYFRVTTGIVFFLIVAALFALPFENIGFGLLLHPGRATAAELTFLLFLPAAVTLLVYNILHPKLHKLLLNLGSLFSVCALLAFAVASSYDGESAGKVLLFANSLTAALILGSVLGAMITGHWYLVQRDLTLQPLKTASMLFVGAVVARVVVLAATVAFYKSGNSAMDEILGGWHFSTYVFWGRVIVGLLIPLTFGIMVWNATKIRSTQSATGILYATIVLVLIGETFSKFLYLITGFPL